MTEFIVPDWPAPPHVRALSTTRTGGSGSGRYASFNLAAHVGDDPAVVAANRERLCAHARVAPRWLQQVHGIDCVDAAGTAADAVADAAFARQPQRACVVMTADCLPLLFCDEDGSVVAAAHAGWRGLAAGVIESTVAAMQVDSARLMVWLGPAIGPGAFEVGDDVRDAFMATDAGAAAAFVPHAAGKWLCDIYALARRRLARLGIERVSGGGYCTHAEGDRFFSYRRDGVTGRMATLVWLTVA